MLAAAVLNLINLFNYIWHTHCIWRRIVFALSELNAFQKIGATYTNH